MLLLLRECGEGADLIRLVVVVVVWRPGEAGCGAVATRSRWDIFWGDLAVLILLMSGTFFCCFVGRCVGLNAAVCGSSTKVVAVLRVACCDFAVLAVVACTSGFSLCFKNRKK